MNFLIIVGQRKETYPGEYAPEALAVIDEYGNDDNPDYIRDQKARALATDEFESVVVLTVKVNGVTVMEMLRPTAKSISGEILDPPAEKP